MFELSHCVPLRYNKAVIYLATLAIISRCEGYVGCFQMWCEGGEGYIYVCVFVCVCVCVCVCAILCMCEVVKRFIQGITSTCLFEGQANNFKDIYIGLITNP